MREIDFKGGGTIHDQSGGMAAEEFESGPEGGTVSQDCPQSGKGARAFRQAGGVIALRMGLYLVGSYLLVKNAVLVFALPATVHPWAEASGQMLQCRMAES